jgi:transposase-like protein
MKSAISESHFHNEEAAFAYVEAKLWPNGPVCKHCGGTSRIGKLKGKTTRAGLYKCYACRKPFTVRMGTVFESSHIPMRFWLQAIYLMASSKKGISTRQLQRTFGGSMTSSWFMAHRIREAMKTLGFDGPMGGEGGIVEIDETFYGKKADMPVRSGYRHKHAVLSLVERRPAGAVVRSFHVGGTARADLMPIIEAHVSPKTHIMTDEAVQYAALRKSSLATTSPATALVNTCGMASSTPTPSKAITAFSSAAWSVSTSIARNITWAATSRSSISATTTVSASAWMMPSAPI